jgi:hypothetical protein
MPRYETSSQIGEYLGKPVWKATRDGRESVHHAPPLPADSLCDCCGQNIRYYNRALSAPAIIPLIRLRRLRTLHPLLDYHHTRRLEMPHAVGGAWAKLRLWGLIRPHPESHRNGLWSITQNGVRFVDGALSIPCIAREKGMRLIDFVGPLIGVRTALGKKFILEQQMNSSRPRMSGYSTSSSGSMPASGYLPKTCQAARSQRPMPTSSSTTTEVWFSS